MVIPQLANCKLAGPAWWIILLAQRAYTSVERRNDGQRCGAKAARQSVNGHSETEMLVTSTHHEGSPQKKSLKNGVPPQGAINLSSQIALRE